MHTGYGVSLQAHSEERLQERGSLVTSDCREGETLASPQYSNNTNLVKWKYKWRKLKFHVSFLCAYFALIFVMKGTVKNIFIDI